MYLSKAPYSVLELYILSLRAKIKPVSVLKLSYRNTIKLAR